MGLGHTIHIHTNVLTHSSLVLPAPLVIPQIYYNVFSFSSSCSSVLLFHLPRSARPFQLQLDLDKDGFSFSSLFFLALAKKGFARGDYTHAELCAHSQTAAWRHCVWGKTSLLTKIPLLLPFLQCNNALCCQRSTTSWFFFLTSHTVGHSNYLFLLHFLLCDILTSRVYSSPPSLSHYCPHFSCCGRGEGSELTCCQPAVNS